MHDYELENVPLESIHNLQCIMIGRELSLRRAD
jgi:hypothetical protein